ncbi:Rab escort protein 1 [Tanacetum coccineum]
MKNGASSPLSKIRFSNPNAQVVQDVEAWKHSDFLCHNYVLNGLLRMERLNLGNSPTANIKGKGDKMNPHLSGKRSTSSEGLIGKCLSSASTLFAVISVTINLASASSFIVDDPDALDPLFFAVSFALSLPFGRRILILLQKAFLTSLKLEVSLLSDSGLSLAMYPDQATSVRVLQLGSNIAVCPSGMFVVYLSALCNDVLQGKKSLHAAMDRLFSVHTSDTADSSSTDQTDSSDAKDSAEVKPTLLWSALYIQDLIEGSMGPVVTTPTPDGNLNYNVLVGSTLKLFQKLYPDDEFFPETINTDSSDKLDDDSDLLES